MWFGRKTDPISTFKSDATSRACGVNSRRNGWIPPSLLCLFVPLVAQSLPLHFCDFCASLRQILFPASSGQFLQAALGVAVDEVGDAVVIAGEGFGCGSLEDDLGFTR